MGGVFQQHGPSGRAVTVLGCALAVVMAAACKSDPRAAPPRPAVAGEPASTAAAAGSAAGQDRAPEAEKERARTAKSLQGYREALARGRTLTKSRDYRNAIAAFDEAAHVLPNEARVCSERGFARYLAGDLDGAQRDFDLGNTLAKTPKMRAELAFNLGLVAKKRGDAAPPAAPVREESPDARAVFANLHAEGKCLVEVDGARAPGERYGSFLELWRAIAKENPSPSFFGSRSKASYDTSVVPTTAASARAALECPTDGCIEARLGADAPFENALPKGVALVRTPNDAALAFVRENGSLTLHRDVVLSESSFHAMPREGSVRVTRAILATEDGGAPRIAYVATAFNEWLGGVDVDDGPCTEGAPNCEGGRSIFHGSDVVLETSTVSVFDDDGVRRLLLTRAHGVSDPGELEPLDAHVEGEGLRVTGKGCSVALDLRAVTKP